MFINLNINKKFDIDVILYCVKFFFSKILNQINFHFVMLLSRYFFSTNSLSKQISLLIHRIKNRRHNLNIQKNQTHNEKIFCFYNHLHESRICVEYCQLNHVVNYVYGQIKFSINTRVRLYLTIQFWHMSQIWKTTYCFKCIIKINQRKHQHVN